MDSNAEVHSERDPLLNNSKVQISNGSIQEPDPDYELREVSIATYKSRWWILTIFSLMSLTQGGLCTIWNVIVGSAEACFGWTTADLSLLLAWNVSTYLVAVVPFIWLLNTKGLRICMLLTTFLILASCIVRCLSANTPYVTWFAHIGAILNGVAGPVAFACGPVVSAMWFPANERATATAIATIAGWAGSAICYVMGPTMVQEPLYNLSSPNDHHKEAINIPGMKHDIMRLRYIECGWIGAIFICVCIYFPSKPPLAPSRTASITKLDFKSAVRQLFTNKDASQFWLLAVIYGLSMGINSAWLGMEDVIVTAVGILEKEAGWLGFYSTVAGCALALVLGRVADLVSGKLKLLLLLLLTCGAISAFINLLYLQHYLTYNKAGFYTSFILIGVFLNAQVPLFYELSCETAYPIAEEVTTATLTIMYNIFPAVFLFINMIPNIGVTWMNWTFFISLALCLPLLVSVRENYKRLAIDKTLDKQGKERNEEGSLQSSA